MSAMVGRDLYLRITPKPELGAPWVQSHRVWDSERFVASVRKQHRKEGRTVAVITEEQYKEERQGK